MAVLYPVLKGPGANTPPGPGIPVQSDGKTAGQSADSGRSPYHWLIWLGMGLTVPPPDVFRMPLRPADSPAASDSRKPSLLSRLVTGQLSRGRARHLPTGSEPIISGATAETPRTGSVTVLLPEESTADGPRTARRALGQLGAYLRGDKWLPQLIRFALVGGLSNIGYFLLFLAFYGGGAQLANLAGSIVSTALANELHRRLTFHAADRVGWITAQLEGGGLALAGLAITSAALAVLDFVAPGMSDIAEALAVIAIAAAVGTLRFLTLRLWVF
ncbi:putative flippase GtrA [Nocardia mexicana]|uniref:Putative flippase GtrA n=2 Tax=Nocardia mexicana TaxID=279262 RepID=A0A370H0K4_9NOCA|nr:putative flippase GtrA [Nocardia mexicana]